MVEGGGVLVVMVVVVVVEEEPEPIIPRGALVELSPRAGATFVMYIAV